MNSNYSIGGGTFPGLLRFRERLTYNYREAGEACLYVCVPSSNTDPSLISPTDHHFSASSLFRRTISALAIRTYLVVCSIERRRTQ